MEPLHSMISEQSPLLLSEPHNLISSQRSLAFQPLSHMTRQPPPQPFLDLGFPSGNFKALGQKYFQRKQVASIHLILRTEA